MSIVTDAILVCSVLFVFFGFQIFIDFYNKFLQTFVLISSSLTFHFVRGSAFWGRTLLILRFLDISANFILPQFSIFRIYADFL